MTGSSPDDCRSYRGRNAPVSLPQKYHVGRRGVLAAATCLLAAGAPAPANLSFATLYGAMGPGGVQLTPEAQALVGRRVDLRGFMAPPLKPESDFFVLTRYPMSVCPFCSSGADWPVDIVLVKLGEAAETIEPSYAIDVTGTLEHGMEMDKQTGFVSLVRLVDAAWRRV